MVTVKHGPLNKLDIVKIAEFLPSFVQIIKGICAFQTPPKSLYWCSIGQPRQSSTEEITFIKSYASLKIATIISSSLTLVVSY